MAMFIKDNGEMIAFMELENIHAKMDISMKVNGIKGKKKVKENKNGKMSKNIKANIKMDSNMDVEFLNLRTRVFMKENLLVIKLMEEVLNNLF